MEALADPLVLAAAAAAGVENVAITASAPTRDSTIYRTKNCFEEIGLEVALNEASRPGAALA